MSDISVDSAFDLPGYSMSFRRSLRSGCDAAYSVVVSETDGIQVANGEFVAETPDTGFFEDIYVSIGRRRRGIATAIYDAFEAAGFDVHPSNSLDADGVLFWAARTETRSRSTFSIPRR